jgi:hypothetical protein
MKKAKYFLKAKGFINTWMKNSTILITPPDSYSKVGASEMLKTTKYQLLAPEWPDNTLSFEDLNFFGCFEMDVAFSIRGWTGFLNSLNVNCFLVHCMGLKVCLHFICNTPKWEHQRC